MPTFAQNYDWGDVIYGLSAAREPYVKSLGPGIATWATESGAYVTCDHYNNRTWLKSGMASIRSTDTRANIQSNFDDNQGFFPGVEQQESLKHFYDQLMKSDRDPSKAAEVKESHYKKSGNPGLEDLQIRRACKFGIEYMISKGRTVHFVLDIPTDNNDGRGTVLSGTYIDDQAVVDKTPLAGRNDNYVPITTSELRLCYRHWDKWGPTGKLKFYQSLQEVNPPWVANPVVWNLYAQHRADKALKKKYGAFWKVMK